MRRARQLGEALSFEELHGDVGHAVVDAVVEDLDDVGAAQRRGGLRLALEALEHLRAAGDLGVDELIATGDESAMWSARQTEPMPPCPSCETRR